jgi:recombination endonuclease VII
MCVETASQAIARVRHRNSARSCWLKANYGISLDDYERMLERQGGVCAICKQKSDETLCVDHCHRTRKLRSPGSAASMTIPRGCGRPPPMSRIGGPRRTVRTARRREARCRSGGGCADGGICAQARRSNIAT